jgi:hypothetical protein
MRIAPAPRIRVDHVLTGQLALFLGHLWKQSTPIALAPVSTSHLAASGVYARDIRFRRRVG